MHQSDEATFQKEIGDFLDTEGFAKFLAATAVTSNGDNMFAMGHNFYLWLNPKTNKFVYLPWDLNMAFGGFPIGDPIHLSVKKPYNGESKLTDRFLAIPAFRAAYDKSCREGAKIMTELDALHDSVASAAKPIMALDPKDGGGGFPGGPAGGGQGGLGGRRGGGPGGQGGGFGGTNDLKVFFAQRSASVIAQLEGKEEGVVPQGGGPGGGGPGGPGGPGGGFDMAAMLGTSFLQLTGAGEAPTLTAFNDAWKKGAVFCDKNKDGKLIQEELTAGVGAVLGGGFGPGQFLGPQIWSALKAKESISVATFTATMAQWGASWDTNKDGKLNVPEVGAGLAKILPPPDFGGGF